jgi:hypothetical protein
VISDDLTALADRLAPYERHGAELHPVAMALLVAALRDLAEQVRGLEGRPVPPHQRGVLPPGVLPFRGRAA